MNPAAELIDAHRVLTFAWVVVVIGSAIIVFVDASARDWTENRWAKSPVIWGVGVLAFWIGVLPLYLSQRSKAPPKQNPPASRTPGHPPATSLHGPDTSGSVPPPG